ncbi:C2 domain-containing protein, partial [Pelagophyceae sp. CCMP2097]
SSDPYTRVAVGSSWQVTKTKKKTLAPVWNEALAFELFGDESEAAVSVWDWDLVGSDDLLGRVSLPL